MYFSENIKEDQIINANKISINKLNPAPITFNGSHIVT